MVPNSILCAISSGFKTRYSEGWLKAAVFRMRRFLNGRASGPRTGVPPVFLFGIVLLCRMLTGCGSYVVDASPDAIQFSPATVDFGVVDIGTSAQLSFKVVNIGKSNLNLGGLVISGKGFSFVSPVQNQIVLSPGLAQTYTIAFSPTSAGDSSGQLMAMDGSKAPLASAVIHGQGRRPRIPQLTLSGSALDFGSVALNSAASKTLTLTSTGSGRVTVDSASIAGIGFALVGGPFPVTLDPSQSMQLQVGFDPNSAGSATGQITVVSDSASGSTSTVSLTGSGAAAPVPKLTISASSLAFGSVTKNTKQTKMVTLTSSGTGVVRVDAVTEAGGGFALSGAAFPVTLYPGQSVTVDVTFDPTAVSSYNGNLTITASTGLASVSLSGTGVATSVPQLTVSATSLAFGSVTENTRQTKTVTLTSSGTAAVTVNAITVAGSVFSLSNASFPITLNPGQSLPVQITFDPPGTSNYTGTITITSNSSTNASATISLSGTGVVTAVPQLTVSAVSLAFGSVTDNTNQTKTVTLTSSGTAAVTVNAVSEAGAGFTLSDPTFPVTLNPGQSAAVQVTFDPTAASTYSGNITIKSTSSTGSTTNVGLSGTGVAASVPQLTVSSSNLAFGIVTENIKQTKTVTLTSSGTAAVTVNAVSEAGAGFTLSGSTFPVTLNPGQSTAVQVTFDPTVASTYSGNITIMSTSSTGGTANVSLSGTGVAASNAVLTVSSANLSFGNVPVGTPSTLSLTLTSTGTSPVTVNGESVTGAGFTVSGATFPVTLNPTISIALQVHFDPAALGSAKGQIKFASNSSSGSATLVALNGNGTAVQHEVNLTWGPPSNSPVPVNSYNVYRSTGTSSYLLVDSQASTNTTYVDSSVQASTTYAYYVKSVDSAGVESVPSNQVTVTIP